MLIQNSFVQRASNEWYTESDNWVMHVYQQAIFHSHKHLFYWVNDTSINLWPFMLCRQILDKGRECQTILSSFTHEHTYHHNQASCFNWPVYSFTAQVLL